METTLYKKVGRKYIEHDTYSDNLNGLPQGLYLLYKNNYKGEHSAMMNMLYYAKVHDIKNVGSFSDFYIAHEAILNETINKAINKWFETHKSYSTNDLSIIVCKALSEIK